MRLRIFAIITALSAILCVAACALWVQSYQYPGEVVYLRGKVLPDGMYYFRHSGSLSFRGRVIIVHQMDVTPHDPHSLSERDRSNIRLERAREGLIMEWFIMDRDAHLLPGFGYSKINVKGRTIQLTSWRIEFPNWSLVAAFTILPILWLARIRWNPAYYARRHRPSPKTIWIERATFVGLVFGGASAGAIILLMPKISPVADKVFYGLAALTLILVGSVSALVWQRFDGSRQIATKDLCPQCGYDLRATPDRCPECGMSVVAG